MEHDARSMIESARRMARRLAKKTTTPYQTCLDDVARQLGREHWAAYMKDPVPVPRATPQDEAARTGAPVNHEGGVAIPPGLARLIGEKTAATYGVPTDPHPLHNAMGHIQEQGADQRKEMVRVAAGILMGDDAGGNHFAMAARDALVAFMHWELATADAAGTLASLSGMVVSMRAGIEASARKATVTGDRFGEWLTSIADAVAECPEARRTLEHLSTMDPHTRSNVFGALDRALTPFAVPRAMAA